MSHLGQCYMNVMPSCYVSSLCIAIMLCCISVYCHHVMLHLSVLPSCYVPSRCIAMGASLKYEKVVLNGEQKKYHLCEDWIEKSVPWDHCHHLTSLLTVVLGMDLSILPSHS